MRNNKLLAKLKTNLLWNQKAVLTMLLFCFFAASGWAQDANNQADLKEDKDYLNYVAVEQKPEYPGGIKELYKFLITNFRLSEEAQRAGVKGQAIIDFMVEKDGSLGDFKIIKDLGYGIGHEVIRVLKRARKWTPGTLRDKPVRVLYRMPITVG